MRGPTLVLLVTLFGVGCRGGGGDDPAYCSGLRSRSDAYPYVVLAGAVPPDVEDVFHVPPLEPGVICVGRELIGEEALESYIACGEELYLVCDEEHDQHGYCQSPSSTPIYNPGKRLARCGTPR